MTNSVRAYQITNEPKSILRSVASTSAKSPEEALNVLERLDRMGIESFVTKGGDLLVRYWTIGAEGFVNPEHAAIIRSNRPSPEQTDNLDWLSKNLTDIRRQHSGQWIAIYDNEVVAADPKLPDLMNQVTDFDRPLITFVPSEPIVWTFTYVS